MNIFQAKQICKDIENLLIQVTGSFLLVLCNKVRKAFKCVKRHENERQIFCYSCKNPDHNIFLLSKCPSVILHFSI